MFQHIQRKMLGKGTVRVNKEPLSSFRQDMGNIIRIIKLSENSGVLIDGVSETVINMK